MNKIGSQKASIAVVLFLATAAMLAVGAAVAQVQDSEPTTDYGPDHRVWYPSKWGADDQLGAANLLSPDLVLTAAKLIATGKTYALGIPISEPLANSLYTYRNFQVRLFQYSNNGEAIGVNRLTVVDDEVHAYQGVGTQLDGFGHAAIDWTHYNGAKTSEIVANTGIRKFSNHAIPPIVTRGVLLDVARFKGVDRLPPSLAINAELLQEVQRAQGSEIREGDVVLIHTGWLETVLEDQKLHSPLPGLGVEGARYLIDQGVIIVGADTPNLEVTPAELPNRVVPVHQELLVKGGVYMLQMVRTSELARDRVYEFFFVLGQPRLVGTVQTIVNPIAIR